ncbi:hypothetical protein CathTA2_2253 [Caldalkalibacillus thermarum TA2.A1]|uniref:Uncharacterized protein n=1 Tax=Caldalkalibacillus thermarum (strain TA2.A1) TaxID=986075 RepID=F5L8U8_CALTT|nr:hypothetical protein [Caldalkalibacillus thermarum]EGL82230.1 hypothetical protein CathTA2_2253 [Caldalkalibacillus thermarum TA2.A1]QZT32754.1 hypothetical protein HUR95_10200 [Caldalkalibacillus thermarum TA2.A1]
MFFSKRSRYHGLVLYIYHDQPHPLLLVMPEDVAGDVLSTIKKFEKSALNAQEYIGQLGPFSVVHEIQGFEKITIHHDTLSWSEPILYTDFAKKISDRLQDLMDQVQPDLEEELVYFIGEFTMMQDNGFVAPF